VGPLTLPPSGLVYVDANAVIYSVEHVEPYLTLLTPLWTTSGPTSFQIVTSELTLPEVLIRPFRTNNARLETEFRKLLQQTADVRLAPITQGVLERGARLRAAVPSLRTPDAIHAATALIEDCALLVTNDPGFRQVPGLNATVLNDLLTP
jgi:predicted nucleic acid-binding protein